MAFGNSNTPTCELLGFESLVLQASLGGLAILLLAIKRYHETPRRPWKIWLFDVGKQVIGALLVHSLNVVASIAFSGEDLPDTDGNPCTWYFLNILFDTTIGVPILWLCLWYVYNLAFKFGVSGIMSGEYGDPPQYGPFGKQLGLYLIAVIISKILLSLVLYYVPFLDNWGAFLISWTDFDARVQIAFVMLIFPAIMNSVQYYVVDSIIQSPQFGSTSNTISDTERQIIHNYSTFAIPKHQSNGAS